MIVRLRLQFDKYDYYYYDYYYYYHHHHYDYYDDDYKDYPPASRPSARPAARVCSPWLLQSDA